MGLADNDDIPLPGDLDPEDESPYLRRQKAVGVRRARLSRRVWLILKAGFFSLIILAPLGIGGYALLSFALASPRFLLSSWDDISIVGNQYVSREEVLSALGIPGPGNPGGSANIFRMSIEAKRRQVESIPWIRSATLTRAYPHRLAVQVVERAPVAFVNVGGHVKLVDEEGVWLDRPEKGVFDFPVIRGLEPRGSVVEPRSRLSLYMEFTRQLTGELSASGWTLSEVDLADPDDLRAVLAQGSDTIQAHFGDRDFLQRFHNFLDLWPEVRTSNPKIDSVDLRYHRQVIVSPKE